MHELKDKWAVVTGASSGMGRDYADILAEAGCHLVLVARRKELLQELQVELKTKHGVKVETVVMDLAVSGAPKKLYDALKLKGLTIDVLINNAGVGLYGEFVDSTWDDNEKMLQLDIINLVQMTKLFVNDMVARNSGYVLNVASIAAYQSCPQYASYGAAKSYVLNFTEALNYELRTTKVKVTAISPGTTKTGFFDASGQDSLTLYQRLSMMESRPVALMGLKAMLKGRPSIVPGTLNMLTIFSGRFMPRRLMALIGNRLISGAKS